MNILCCCILIKASQVVAQQNKILVRYIYENINTVLVWTLVYYWVKYINEHLGYRLVGLAMTDNQIHLHNTHKLHAWNTNPNTNTDGRSIKLTWAFGQHQPHDAIRFSIFPPSLIIARVLNIKRYIDFCCISRPTTNWRFTLPKHISLTMLLSLSVRHKVRSRSASSNFQLNRTHRAHTAF